MHSRIQGELYSANQIQWPILSNDIQAKTELIDLFP